MDERPPQLQVDQTALRAMAHPLRVRLFELLDREGPATASRLAERVGESSGTTSYHLRQLAKHGFIEEDPDRGTRRERWWRVYPGGVRLEGWRFFDDPTATGDVLLIARELVRTYAAELDQWLAESPQWETRWVQASTDSSFRFDGTSDDLAALRDEVVEVIQRHRERARGPEAPDDAVRITVHFHAFPARRRESEDE